MEQVSYKATKVALPGTGVRTEVKACLFCKRRDVAEDWPKMEADGVLFRACPKHFPHFDAQTQGTMRTFAEVDEMTDAWMRFSDEAFAIRRRMRI